MSDGKTILVGLGLTALLLTVAVAILPSKSKPKPAAVRAPVQTARMSCTEMTEWLAGSLSDDDWPYVLRDLQLPDLKKVPANTARAVETARRKGYCD